MKLLPFIKWLFAGIVANIKSWDRWMYGWIVTCAWGPSAIMDREQSPTSFNLFVDFVLIFWFGYGLVYTSIKNAYKKFQKEQQDLLDTIKHSDAK
jgi:hypothetical protein